MFVIISRCCRVMRVLVHVQSVCVCERERERQREGTPLLIKTKAHRKKKSFIQQGGKLIYQNIHRWSRCCPGSRKQTETVFKRRDRNCSRKGEREERYFRVNFSVGMCLCQCHHPCSSTWDGFVSYLLVYFQLFFFSNWGVILSVTVSLRWKVRMESVSDLQT